MKKRTKVRGMRLVLLYLCLDNFKHPDELSEILKGKRKSSYDRNISKYLNRLERDELMISKYVEGKKYFKSNENKIAELVIESKKTELEKEKEFFEEEKKKFENGKAPKWLKNRHLRITKPKTKIPSEGEAIQIFRDMFSEDMGNISLKNGNSYYKLADYKNRELLF